ncbi:hypothetical protein BCR36DRAFT_415340 [Piromyces finnis]|uniref:DnaJ-domain-containing protein n=1 Tax=Piromyces finnis TaxID=1754191 RepID=A0A1Y1V0E0_9FUNG|nr:hypothetical protein BCR36DRAFT_415340 [Piromyces finnis]|eukprot:ORX43739.1 hypothetical protein BCR36DRAFT_415340 [Piromyces finnis]
MSNFNNLSFYQLFQIDKNFSESELKKAYYRLSLKYHPDKNSKMEDMFKYINKAYEILNSPQKKKVYDEFGISAFNGIEIKNEYKKFNNLKNKTSHKKLNDFEVSVFDDLNENSLFRYDESSDDELSSDVLNYSYLSSGEMFSIEEKKNNKSIKKEYPKEKDFVKKNISQKESVQKENQKGNIQKGNVKNEISKKEKEIIQKEIFQKKPDIKIDVSLEDLYTGVEKQVKIERKAICPKCLGQHHTFLVCENCLGNGYSYNVNTEKEVVCKVCNGIGKRKSEKKEQCLSCHGKTTINETKTLIAHILPGMKHNEKIIFKCEGDQSLKAPPKDIIATINILPHPNFTMNGYDLITNVNISLKEALCGLRRRIKFLDGSYLNIMTNPGEVITPFSVKYYKNKGFVKNVGSKEKGNLKIKFFVQFPENNWTNLEDIKILEKILSKKKINNEKYIPPEELAKEDIDINLNEYPSPISVKSSLSSSGMFPEKLSPSERLSPEAVKSSTPFLSPNTARITPNKKSPIDQFYLCDINSSNNINPRTISIAEPIFNIENNPPRTISVIDSMIMPVKGEDIYDTSSSLNEDSYKKEIEKQSPPIRSARRLEDSKRGFSDDENFKNIKVISPKSLKSPKELELIDKNKNVISNNRNDVKPPPLPPFPKNQKQITHSRSVSLERTTKNTFSPIPKSKLIHSNTFNVRREQSPKPMNYDIKSLKSIDRVNNPYVKYNI